MMGINSGLRELLRRDKIVVAPGAFDAFTAKIIQKAGFPAVYMTGYGVSASLLGQPDVGLITMSEMIAQASNIASAVSIPVIADADTGYGGYHNVVRTVKEYEKAGVSGIHIEDQVTPKRCAHMKGVRVIYLEEMLKKIEVACDARQNPNFLIIARTDSATVNGLKDAIKRGNAMARAGADVIYIESIRSEDELKLVAKSIEAPLMVNMMEDGVTPLLPVKELEKMGFKIVIFPLSSLYVAAKAIIDLVEELKQKGTTKGYIDRMVSNEHVNEIVGLPMIEDFEERFTKRKEK